MACLREGKGDRHLPDYVIGFTGMRRIIPTHVKPFATASETRHFLPLRLPGPP
jgi:hypothetical protein